MLEFEATGCQTSKEFDEIFGLELKVASCRDLGISQDLVCLLRQPKGLVAIFQSRCVGLGQDRHGLPRTEPLASWLIIFDVAAESAARTLPRCQQCTLCCWLTPKSGKLVYRLKTLEQGVGVLESSCL